ncbi:MAG TPA: hypothetical protein VGM57_05160 [Pseudolabrys sp.]|jgi:hypothetical protein
MTSDNKSSSADEGRVVSFRSGRPVSLPPTEPPVEGLAKYQGKESPEDYHDRMIVNIAAFIFLLALVGGGFWLADTMAQMRKNEDCAASGRRNCIPIEFNHQR